MVLFINASGPLAFAAPSRGGKAPPPPEIPASLLFLNEREARHALLVDKSEQRLYLYQWEGDVPRLVKTFPCSTGENPGGKNRNGDKRTPAGVYFFTRVIEGNTLPPIYGIRAFPTDYPNLVDRLHEKEGDGIWLHGTDQPLSSKSTKGCVVLENRDVAELSTYIRLRRTPIVIEEKISKISLPELKKTGERVRGMLEEWRQAWETKQLDRYMSFYAASFRSGKKDRQGWRSHKDRLNRQYRNIRVRVADPIILRHERHTLAIFQQSYSSDRFSNEGTKRLYFDAELKIVGEEWDAHKTGEAPPPIPPKVLQAFLKPKPVKVAAVKTPAPAPSPRAAVAKAPAPAPAPAPQAAVASETAPARAAGGEAQDVRDFVETWRQAWQTKDLDTYMDCYSRSFRAQGKGWAQWKQHKRGLNERYRSIKVALKKIKIGKTAGGMRVTFYQDYRSDGVSSVGMKSIELRREKNAWKIIGERFLASRK